VEEGQGRQWRWHARISLTDGSRPLVPLDPDIPHEDTAGAAECAATTSAYFRENGMAPDTTKETVAEYAARWLSDREGRVNPIRDDRGRMNHHVLPVLGPLDVTRFGRDDVERLRDALDVKIADGTLSWKTAANCWTVITSMCSDMVSSKRRELRVRDDNATDKVRAPERGGNKAKQYLYPSEFLTFVSCEKIPLRWRRAVAVAVYTYTRDGELRVLRWDGGDVDLEHGMLSITRACNRRTKDMKGTKTGESRRFAVEANLLPLLTTMRSESHEKGLVIALPSERAMARNLRRWLWKANVRRPELHKGSPTRKQLTWHDLRATGATWMAVRGDDPLKIKQRCGHQTFSTTEIYIREAEAVREGFGEVFPALPAALQGPTGNSGRILARGRIPVTIGPKTRPFERGGRDSNPRMTVLQGESDSAQTSRAAGAALELVFFRDGSDRSTIGRGLRRGQWGSKGAVCSEGRRMRDITALQSVLVRFAQVEARKRNTRLRAELCAAGALRLVVAQTVGLIGRVPAREDHFCRDALAERGERSVKGIDACRPRAARRRDGVIARIRPALRCAGTRSIRAAVPVGDGNDTAAMAY
jgi:integrase